MKKIENILIEKGHIVKEDLNNRKFDFSEIYIHFLSSIGKMILALFILLTIAVFLFITLQEAAIDLGLILMPIIGLICIHKFNNNFLANIFTVLVVFIDILYYFKNLPLAATGAYALFIGTLIYYKNYDIFSLLLPGTYGYITLLYIKNLDFSYKYLVGGITLLNFLILILFLIGQSIFRKSKYGKSYKLIVIELILTSLILSVYYEFNNISVFFGSTNKDYFIYIQNALYALSNIYLLTKLKLIKNEYKILNTILLIISIKVPFIAFALFIYNLAIFYNWKDLRKIAYIFLLSSTFLLYHTFSITFLQKSIFVGMIGVVMLGIYIYLNKVGENIER